MAIVVVAKKTNGMLHDAQYKEEKDMDADDFILEGWDYVPSTEELAKLHDQEVQDAVIAAATAAAALIKEKETVFLANLPTWAKAAEAIKAAFPTANQQNVILKIARVVYLLARNSID